MAAYKLEPPSRDLHRVEKARFCIVGYFVAHTRQELYVFQETLEPVIP